MILVQSRHTEKETMALDFQPFQIVSDDGFT